MSEPIDPANPVPPAWLDTQQPDAAHEEMRVAIKAALAELQRQIGEITKLKTDRDKHDSRLKTAEVKLGLPVL